VRGPLKLKLICAKEQRDRDEEDIKNEAVWVGDDCTANEEAIFFCFHNLGIRDCFTWKNNLEWRRGEGGRTPFEIDGGGGLSVSLSSCVYLICYLI